MKKIINLLSKTHKEIMFGRVYDGGTKWIAEIYDEGCWVLKNSRPITTFFAKSKKEVLKKVSSFLKNKYKKDEMRLDDQVTLIKEEVAVCFKPQSFIQEISDYYFNDSVDTLIRNEDDILLEVRVNDYLRSDYDSIDFEYVEELEELIKKAKEEGITLLKVRCE